MDGVAAKTVRIAAWAKGAYRNARGTTSGFQDVAAGASQRGLECRQEFVHIHAPAIIRIDVARLHDAVLADDESGRYREHPRLVALVRGDVETAGPHRLALVVTDPEHQIEFKGVA